jgi:hypothetical protein
VIPLWACAPLIALCALWCRFPPPPPPSTPPQVHLPGHDALVRAAQAALSADGDGDRDRDRDAAALTPAPTDGARPDLNADVLAALGAPAFGKGPARRLWCLRCVFPPSHVICPSGLWVRSGVGVRPFFP